MTTKKSFLIHLDSLDVLDHLTDEQCGQLLRAFKSYNSGEELNLSPVLSIAFTPFKNQFTRDIETYENVCNRNKINGLKGGRPKTQKTQVVLKETQRNPKEPKKPDSDNKNDNDNKKNTSLVNDGQFGLFWSNYPKKVDKKQAEAKFNRLTANLKRLAIDDCAMRYSDTPKQFIPSPRKYILGEKWNDEIIKQGQNNGAHKQTRESSNDIFERGTRDAYDEEEAGSIFN